MVNPSPAVLFHGEILRKKLKKKTWKEYWVVLQEDRLVFMNDNESKIAGVITLTEETTCKVLGRKTSSEHSTECSEARHVSKRKQVPDDGPCKFKLHAKRGVHLLKTDCKSSCDKWIDAISCVVQSMWINSANGPPSTTGRKHRFRTWLQRDCNKIRNSFSYTSLSEEDQDHLNEGNRVKATVTRPAIFKRFSSTKGKFEKWKKLPGRIVSRRKAGNYGVLVEDITD